jgi:transcriptional regulator with XRE-family HTH domain
MGRKRSNVAIEVERHEQYERGQRIKYIREQELHLSKTDLAAKIGTSSQFLGLVEEGKGNLVYYSIKKLRQISGHSSDYILFGIDDEVITKTRELLSEYSEAQIADALYIIRKLTHFVMDEKI